MSGNLLFDEISNAIIVAANVIALMICLFRYIHASKRAWLYVILFQLGNLLSNYYWSAYTLLLERTPDVTSVLAYFGWNLSYIPLILLLIKLQTEEEQTFISPLCILPIPINILIFYFFIPQGELANNSWKGICTTVIAILSLNSILYYRKNRKKGAPVPYLPIVLLGFVICIYVMHASVTVTWPSEWLNPYYYAHILCFSSYFFVPWAVSKTLGDSLIQIDESLKRRLSFLKLVFFIILTACCMGGYMVSLFMKDVLTLHTAGHSVETHYSYVSVMLFVFSILLVVFSLAFILFVSLGRKEAESNELRNAKDMAEHTSAIKSEFLARISHEIRTPINAVLGMNEMVLRESMQARDALPEENEDIQEVFRRILGYSGNIQSAGSNLLGIINDILDISRIESGKIEIAEADYKLSSVLNDVTNMISYKAKDKGLDFDINIDDAIPDDLHGDEVRIRQILTNLLNNAVKYTKEGSIHLSIQKYEGDPIILGEPIHLIIKVKDTGIGIKPEDIDRIFDKYERFDLKNNSAVEGTGLGLTITRNLLEIMGGSIEVHSNYNVGSVFTIILPQTIVSTEPIGDFEKKFNTSIEEQKVYKESFRAPDAHILIVDDTRMNLLVVEGLLKNTEIKIDNATSGREAIDISGSIQYDLILMDQRMPEMDGTEAMKRIKANESGPNKDTPFICLTADAVKGARGKYLNEGFTDYLSKPIDSRALEQTLIKYLPEDKVSIMKNAQATPSKADEKAFEADKYDSLTSSGIYWKNGLKYCDNDMAIFRTVLEEFAQSSKEKAKDLQTYYDVGDLNTYAVLVHSLKSTSRLIGAVKLSEAAELLEIAANTQKLDIIENTHAAMMAQYANVVAAINPLFEGEEQRDKEPSGEDDDILEFMPE